MPENALKFEERAGEYSTRIIQKEYGATEKSMQGYSRSVLFRKIMNLFFFVC
jgi:hypothetical protein